MIHESECRNPNLTSYKEKSLLSKYEIPIENLSYEYIEQCNSAKELERIVKVLRSGEEGLYPDLIQKAEERLKLIHPKSRLLTIEQPALTKYTMAQEDWNGTIHDLNMWTEEIKIKDNDLFEASMSKGNGMFTHPPVRKISLKQKSPLSADKETKQKTESISSCDYKKWDNYDAETEILKMDVDEEKKMIERKKNENKKVEEDLDSRINDVVAHSENLSEVERQYLAGQEKNRGNEFFYAGDLEEAIKCYTTSIAIYPTSVAFNNRAMCYLKDMKFSNVLEDTNKAIELDPENNKAYYRRALAYQHKNEFHKALNDMRKVLQKEPNHVLARHYFNCLNELIQEMPKKVRLLLEGTSPDGKPKKEIVVVSEEEYKKNPKYKKGIKVNHWGLSTNVCNCNGTPPSIRYLNTAASHSKLAERILGRRKPVDNQLDESASTSVEAKIISLEDEKCDKPKRLQIIEVDRLDETCDKPKFSIVDKRGMNGNLSTKSSANNSQMNEAIASNSSGAIPKNKIAFGDCHVHSKSIKTSINEVSRQKNSADSDKC